MAAAAAAIAFAAAVAVSPLVVVDRLDLDCSYRVNWAVVVAAVEAVAVSASFAVAVVSVLLFAAFECRPTVVEGPCFATGLFAGLLRQWSDVGQLVGLGDWEGAGRVVLSTFAFHGGSFD